MQLISERARAIIRTGGIDAFLAARSSFDAFVDVCAKSKLSSVRLSDVVFFSQKNLSARTYTSIVVESISRLALATITARYVGAFVALADTSRAFVDV